MAAVGGGGTGKSRILERFLTGRLQNYWQYDPTILETVTTYRELPLDGDSDFQGVTLHLTDVSGQAEYSALRSVDCYRLQHLIMICFSIDSRASLEYAQSECMEEVRQGCHRDIPFVLVGCQSDKRGRIDTEVSVYEAHWAAMEMGAAAYFECSAFTGDGVDDLLQGCCEIALTWVWPERSRAALGRDEIKSRRDKKRITSRLRRGKRGWSPGCILM